jgi:hypothetical protein
LEKESEIRLRKKLDELCKMDAIEREAHLVRLEIVESVLNLTCPRCQQVFFDFNGCFALTCSRCSCAFCAWCLADCGEEIARKIKPLKEMSLETLSSGERQTISECRELLKARFVKLLQSK